MFQVSDTIKLYSIRPTEREKRLYPKTVDMQAARSPCSSTSDQNLGPMAWNLKHSPVINAHLNVGLPQRKLFYDHQILLQSHGYQIHTSCQHLASPNLLQQLLQSFQSYHPTHSQTLINDLSVCTVKF